MVRPRLSKTRKLTKSEQMARVRSKDTEPELILRKHLWRAGLRYRLRPRLPGTPDLAFPKKKIAVFVDGCFWHGCPVHYTRPATNSSFWREKLKRNRARDRRANRKLKKLGWTVLRTWEHELTEDVASVVARIRSLVTD